MFLCVLFPLSLAAVTRHNSKTREGSALTRNNRASSGATPDAAAAVRNLLDSLRTNQSLGRQPQQQRQQQDKPYPYLTHLLPPQITLPMLDAASADAVDALLGLLPATVLLLALDPESDEAAAEDASAAELAALLTPEQKRDVLERVLRSPQFHQALTSLTMALRDGGLPTVAEALRVPVANGGYIPGAGMPLGGGFAVEAFVEGVRKKVREAESEA